MKTFKKNLQFLFIAVLAASFSLYAQSQVPQLINYQGILKDAAGKPTVGPVIITFAMYSAASGGAALWTETHTDVPLTNGIFDVLLGSKKDFPKDLFTAGGERWLGITVDKNAEMTPRFRFTSVAYALNAAFAETALSGNTLDRAYDQGGAGAGRTINANAGAVNIAGNGGLTIDGKVGIGVATPSYPLHIFSENNTYGMRLDHDKTTAGATVGMNVDVDNTNSESGNTYGIRGFALKNNGTSNVYGLYGYADGTSSGAKYGVFCSAGGSGTRWAGYFSGNTKVTGTLEKGAGSFVIDHPLDPKNKYLYHSFVESPDMMNIYNGNVILDANGEAWIELPEWFKALNKDFRYQLTCIGGYAQVFIAQEIENNRFKIAGGQEGLKVSWQVTGIRQDAFAEKNRIQVERDKTGSEAGKYLHPAAFDMPESIGIDYEKNKEIEK